MVILLCHVDKPAYIQNERQSLLATSLHNEDEFLWFFHAV